jgi:hypothetical protein
MRACPKCGHQNDEAASTCAQCNKRLTPLVFPVADRVLGTTASVLLFLLGVGLNLAIGFAVAAITPTNVCFSFLGMLTLGMLFVFVFPKKMRLFGYGMLAGALSFPIWVQIGCVPVLYYR